MELFGYEFNSTNVTYRLSVCECFFSTMLCKDISQLLDSIFVGGEKNKKKAFGECEIDGRLRPVNNLAFEDLNFSSL